MENPIEAESEVVDGRYKRAIQEGGAFKFIDLLDVEQLRAAGCSDSVAAQPRQVHEVNKTLARILRHVSENPRQQDTRMGAPNAGGWFEAKYLTAVFPGFTLLISRTSWCSLGTTPRRGMSGSGCTT
jgi:hypothetical protein